jgi:hypothetical protein
VISVSAAPGLARSRFHRVAAVIVVLDEGAQARDVVLLHGDLVADVEDGEIDRGRVGILAAAEADAPAAGALRTGG